MVSQRRTKPVQRAQVIQYAGKAVEFARAAESELQAGRLTAATSLAIHAAINAADAICGARLGARSASQNHTDVLELLRQGGTDGRAIEGDLRRLLVLKTSVEYEPEEVEMGTAARAVERARRCAAIAEQVALGLR